LDDDGPGDGVRREVIPPEDGGIDPAVELREVGSSRRRGLRSKPAVDTVGERCVADRAGHPRPEVHQLDGSADCAAVGGDIALLAAITIVRARSATMSVVSRPYADATPHPVGMRIRSMPNGAATRAACMGPAPPKATIVNRRGSMPRCTVTTCTALTMLALAM